MEMISFIYMNHDLPLICAEDFLGLRITHKDSHSVMQGLKTFEAPELFQVCWTSKFGKCKILIVDSLTLIGHQGGRGYCRVD